MKALRTLLRRLMASVTHRQNEERLSAEVEDHLARQTAENIRAGMTPDEARRQAIVKFGAIQVVKEEYRERSRLVWVEQLVQDIRFATRRLVKDRSFTIAAVVALALGIGANSAVFTIVNAMMLRSLPFDSPDRVVRMAARDGQGRTRGVSLHDFQDWQRANRAFSGMALVYGTSISVSADAPAEEYRGAYISANGFDIVGLSAAKGRGFGTEDDRPGAPAVVILSDRVWQSRYGADPAIIGRAVRVNTTPATVIGVMAPGINFPFNMDVWLPLSQVPAALSRTRNTRDFFAYGRLAESATIAQAQAELERMSAQLSIEYPGTNKDVTAVVQPFDEGFVGTQTRLLLWSLMGAVAFVLLIACANVANLLLARAVDRGQEIAVRTSIGATRWRIVRQLLVESVLLATISGLAGLGLAYYGIRWYDAATADLGRPYWLTFTMDVPVFGFFAGTCLIAALVFGLAPALYVSRTSTSEVLKDGGRSGSTGIRARRWSASLVVAQLTLTIVLLAGAGFMLRSFLHLYGADIGFDTARLLTMSLAFPPQKYASFEERLSFLQRLDERLNGMGVLEGASTASYLPASGGSIRQLAIDGRPVFDRGQPAVVTMITVGSRYFDVLGVPILRGRPFDSRDGEAGRESMIVNERLARMYLPNENPIGKRIRLINDGGVPEAPKYYEGLIVGIAPTIRQRSMQDVDPDPIVYIPHRQDLLMGFYPLVIVRTRDNPAPVATLLRAEVAALDSDIPLRNIRTMDENLALWRWSYRVFGTMFAVFAVIAMVMAAVGLYGVTAYSVAQRRQEIAIRMALGAQQREVSWLVVRRGLVQLAIGLLAGLAGALGVGRLLESLLVQTEPTDPTTLASVTGLLVVVALAACLWPARRAARVDSLVALRYE